MENSVYFQQTIQLVIELMLVINVELCFNVYSVMTVYCVLLCLLLILLEWETHKNNQNSNSLRIQKQFSFRGFCFELKAKLWYSLIGVYGWNNFEMSFENNSSCWDICRLLVCCVIKINHEFIFPKL